MGERKRDEEKRGKKGKEGGKRGGRGGRIKMTSKRTGDFNHIKSEGKGEGRRIE